jgi:hypothetical protein
MESQQAQVTGQLATAVAQQQAAQAAAAAAAVQAAQNEATARAQAAAAVSHAPSTTQAPAPTQTQAPAPTQTQAPAASTPAPAPAPAAAPSGNSTDPALNPFLQCVVQHESGGNYGAVSPNGQYMGAFQFSQASWNEAAEAAGRPDLVGVPPNLASKADQDTMAVTLYSLDGQAPWVDGCS